MPPAATCAAEVSDAGRRLLDHLAGFLGRGGHLEPGAGLVVAASGGPDSTALLWGMSQLARRVGLDLHAAHLDHALDPGSAGRAATARRLCAELGVPLAAARIEIARRRRPGESPEAAARRIRYRFLEHRRRRLGARWVLTAHHADDQAETVLLRLLYGSGVAGLAGIAERRPGVLRPLLELPRQLLADCVEQSGLRPASDPTNDDLRLPRNRIRALLIPALSATWPELRSDLTALSRAAGGARERAEAAAAARTGMRRRGHEVTLDRRSLSALPEILWPFVLARASRLAGLAYPPRRDCRRELRRQLEAGGEVGCDLGAGWRWRSRGELLALGRAPRQAPPPAFSYTFRVPGEVQVAELGLTVRLRPAPLERWMLRGAADKAGLGLRLEPGEAVTVRSRRPGDRLRPFGCTYRRKLKEILIDRQVPRRRRDRLPLLEVGGKIAWVPGVTVDHACRLAAGTRTWLAEVVRP